MTAITPLALADFQALHGRPLVRRAYLDLLGRDPTAAEEAYWVQKLVEGLSRAELVGRIRYSAEGRRVGRGVAGLPLAFAREMAARVPVLSYVIALAKLPRLHRHHRALEATVVTHQDWINESSGVLQRVASEVAAMARELALAQSRFATALENTDRRFATALENTERRLTEDAGDLALAVREEQRALHAALENTERRLTEDAGDLALAVREEQRALHAALQTLRFGSDSVDAIPPDRQDAFYTAFEERFRGPPDVIRRRLALHLPAMQESRAGQPGRPVLDLGSGRGEWLALLRENNLEARGVELSTLTAQASREVGLNVETGDLFAVLKAAPDASLGAVTSFHVIEHMPFDALLQLIAHAHRTLKPGGLLILETPNPENTVVGACNFHADPTHRKPLPPDLLAFAVEHAGFREVSIRRLWEDRIADPWADDAAVTPPSVQRAIDLVRTNFYAPPDYAVLAIRP